MWLLFEPQRHQDTKVHKDVSPYIISGYVCNSSTAPEGRYMLAILAIWHQALKGRNTFEVEGPWLLFEPQRLL
jgi:hypothetical protein